MGVFEKIFGKREQPAVLKASSFASSTPSEQHSTMPWPTAAGVLGMMRMMG
jgi:hypothetical protein